MHVFITFYSKNGTHLRISNSFSFGREFFPQPYCDVFIDRDCPDLSKIPKNAEKYYVSAVFKQDLEIISSLIDERWVIGGPLVKMVQCLRNQVPCNCIPGNYEFSLFGQNSLSNNFTNYWNELTKNTKSIEFNYSLSGGCYWHKCSFCSHKRLTKYDTYSRDIFGLSNLQCDVPTTTVYSCAPSLTPKDLKLLLTIPTPFCIESYLRADKDILNVINTINYPIYCQNKTFLIGLESPSEIIRNRTGKGETDEDILKISEFFVKNGGKIILSVMDQYAFIDNNSTNESLIMLKRLAELNQKYSNLSITYNSSTGWYSIEEAQKFSNNFPIQKVRIKSGPIEYDRYWICLPIDSEEFHNNLMIDTMLDKHNFQISGFDRLSHQYFQIIKKLEQYEDVEINGKQYIKIIIKPRNSLSELFGSLWRNVYYANINEEFRRKCPNPNQISVGQILHFPIFKKY